MATTTMTAINLADRLVSMDFIRSDSKMNRRYMVAGQEVSTGIYETKKVVVHDARAEADDLKLETAGFQLVTHESKVSLLTMASGILVIYCIT
jgi:hypothetical protein